MVSSESGAYGNLPLPLTSFVGREAELDEVRGMVRPGRLLTLTGVGGSGKTRLALEAARSFAGDESLAGISGGAFPDGVWLVELDPLRDPSLVAREAASVLGVGERPGREMERELPAALRDRGCLILLDNCEHLIEACARLAEGLLRRCPHLAVLATSREPLGVSGERIWPVPAMSVPDSPSLEAASRSESARLFAERASASSPGFEIMEANAPAVAEVCRRLEGAPLAIELAASRVRSMTTAQISARLDDALGLLASGPRTAPDRQSTLRATMDWSHDLLDEAERALFRNLAVFSGGFTLEAAEEVCETEVGGGTVLDPLSRLVDESLVRARRAGEAARYRLPEVIRQYAVEKLEESGRSARCAGGTPSSSGISPRTPRASSTGLTRVSGWISYARISTTSARPCRGRLTPASRRLVCASPARSRGSGFAGVVWSKAAPLSSGRSRSARGRPPARRGGGTLQGVRRLRMA